MHFGNRNTYWFRCREHGPYTAPDICVFGAVREGKKGEGRWRVILELGPVLGSVGRPGLGYEDLGKGRR